MNEKPENQKRPRTIYALRCKANGKVYIGKTGDVKSRIQAHFLEISHTIKWQRDHPECKFEIGWYGYARDALKYGKEGFEVWILEENISPEEATDREAYYIDLYKSKDPKYGYNKCGAKRPVQQNPDAQYGLPPNLAKGEET